MIICYLSTGEAGPQSDQRPALEHGKMTSQLLTCFQLIIFAKS